MIQSSSPEYQRTIIGYHGCDRKLALKILMEGEHLKPSLNKFDWLGTGMYFWEHAPRRALQFAQEQQGRNKVKDPVVLGAYINLGRCFDLSDIEHTHQLQPAFDRWAGIIKDSGASMPDNRPAIGTDHDLLLRERDCALLNWYMMQLDTTADGKYHYQTVRGIFQEGPPAFDSSMIREKSHIQIAVRDPSCIIGYFLPTMFFQKGANHGK